MRKILLGVIACALAVSSCQKNEVLDSTQKKERELSYSLVMGQQTTTRTAEMMSLALQSERVDLWAYYNDATATASRQNTEYFKDVLSYSAANGWETAFTRFVPVGEMLGFFAVHPQGYTVERTGAVTTIDYTVKADPADQEDLIAAAWVGEAAGNTPNNITLSMRHLLSQVNFGVYGYKGAQITIENIRVNSVNQTGTYTLAHNAQGSWVVDNSTYVSYNYPQIGNIVPVNGADAEGVITGDWYVFGDGGNFAVDKDQAGNVWYYDGPAGWKSDRDMTPLTNSLMLMPQVLPATASVTFDYTIVDGEGKPVVKGVGASFNLSDAGQSEWKQNCRYVYMLDFEGLLDSRKTTFDVEVIQWENWEAAAGISSPGTGSVNIEYEVQNEATIHIKPNDPNLVGGAYTIPMGLLAPGTTKVTLIFDDKSKAVTGSHNQNISIVIPDGFNLPIEIDFSLVAKDNTNLTIAHPDYTGLITLVDHYNIGASILLQNLDINIPSGSFEINADYEITGLSLMTTAPGTFTLNAGAKMNSLSLKGGRAMIYGELATLNVSGLGTEAYIKNSKVDGSWFKTSDINTFNTSNGFQGFNLIELLSSADFSVIGDILTMVGNSGLIDLGGLDLGTIADLFKGSGEGGLDLGFLNSLISTDFYYCGASTNFSNPYVRANFSTLKGVEYNLLGGGKKYTASLPKAGVTEMPILEQINNFKNRIDPFKGYIGLNTDMLNAVPTYYASTTNFSLQNIISFVNLLDQIMSLMDVASNLGITPELLANLYVPGWINQQPLAQRIAYTVLKVGADAALKAAGISSSDIPGLMQNLSEYMIIINDYMSIIKSMMEPIKQANDFIESIKAYNPWAYNANGAAFTKTTTITGLEAAFSIDANGIGIVINNAYVK